jgi:hypothetical protein
MILPVDLVTPGTFNSPSSKFSKELYQNPSSRFQQMSRQPMVRNAVWMSARLS